MGEAVYTMPATATKPVGEIQLLMGSLGYKVRPQGGDAVTRLEIRWPDDGDHDVEHARESLAGLLGVDPSEAVFEKAPSS